MTVLQLRDHVYKLARRAGLEPSDARGVMHLVVKRLTYDRPLLPRCHVPVDDAEITKILSQELRRVGVYTDEGGSR